MKKFILIILTVSLTSFVYPDRFIKQKVDRDGNIIKRWVSSKEITHEKCMIRHVKWRKQKAEPRNAKAGYVKWQSMCRSSGL